MRSGAGSITEQDIYGDFAAGMLDIGYEGYTGYELCHPLPLVNHKPAGIDFVDKNARLAAQFMRNVVAEARAGRGSSITLIQRTDANSMLRVAARQDSRFTNCVGIVRCCEPAPLFAIRARTISAS